MHTQKQAVRPAYPLQIIIQRHALYTPIASEEFGRKVPKNSAVAVAPLCLSLPPQNVLLFELISFILTSCCTLQIFCVCAVGGRGPEEARLKSFVCSVSFRESGNESTVHLRDEPGDWVGYSMTSLFGRLIGCKC